MDTPERAQIGTPISKVEESPFSNFVNSLSPIKPVKTLNISQTFSSISFTSPPSVFTSPHVSLQKESRFLRRHQFPESAKPESSSSATNNDGGTESIAVAAQRPENSNCQLALGTRISSSEDSLEPQLEVGLPRTLNCNGGSPRCNTALPSDSETSCEERTSMLVPFDEDLFRRGAFEAELNSQETDENREGTSCDWESMMSDATDLIIFDSPNDAAPLEGTFQKQLEAEGCFLASLLSRFPQDDEQGQQSGYHLASTSCEDQVGAEEQLSQSVEPYGQEQIQHTQDNLASSSMSHCSAENPDEKLDNEPIHNNVNRGMRRRCLVFEIPGTRKSGDGCLLSGSTSNSSQEEDKIWSNDKQLVPFKPGSDPSRRILPGIGLHLNALAVATKESRILKQETASSEGSLRVSSVATLESLVNSSSTPSEDDMVPGEEEFLVVDDTSQATEDLAQSSPKKKRRRVENTGEGEACKRCNCKKSKCLKLYCECFAAGVYCVEPCSCQDCFNKPIHEETVLSTRKQIESRNPLAFAPKVIRGSDSLPDLGDESSRTPASARHKRGCNCKKSSCLKKYCECYQGGVGCSISCRCEGCKNAFGRKDGGSILLVTDEIEEESQACEKKSVETGLDLSGMQNEDQNTESNLPRTPLRRFRSSASFLVPAIGKPPRSCLATVGSSSSSGLQQHGLIRSTFLRPQPKTEKRPHQAISGDDEMPAVLLNKTSISGSDVKTLSPNSKRVSPPHHEVGKSPRSQSSRKLILQSIPSFPSLTPRRLGEFQ